MTPFVKVKPSVATNMEHRLALFQQSDEFFIKMFGGRVPTLNEKVQFIEETVQRLTSMNIYENDIYHVKINSKPPFIHLAIQRHDKQGCTNWRHFQQIKNELVGEEYEALELFPAESRLVDTGNEYHLWVRPEEGYRFPFGFGERVVFDEPITYSRCRVQMDGIDPRRNAMLAASTL